MKKGCFLKFIIILTIALAAVLYLVQNKFDEYFLKPGKQLALAVVEDNWDKDLYYVKESKEKDSVKSLLKYYIKGLKSSESLTNENTESLINYLSATFLDSIIDKNEVHLVTKLINESLQNEE